MTGADPSRLFASTPANRLFGFVLERLTPEEAVVSMPARPDFAQEGGILHGGAISAIADTTAAYALVPTLGGDERMTGVEFKINFLEPALPGGEDLVAEGRVVRRGRRIAVAEVAVRQGGRNVATGSFTFLIGRAPGP